MLIHCAQEDAKPEVDKNGSSAPVYTDDYRKEFSV
jgi:hypothetical protein